jgi:hypothetical protein
MPANSRGKRSAQQADEPQQQQQQNSAPTTDFTNTPIAVDTVDNAIDRDDLDTTEQQQQQQQDGKGRRSMRSKQDTAKTDDTVPIVQYREGENLTKHFAQFPGNKTIEVRIAAECAVSTNQQVRGHQLWGTEIYTTDSDLVAVLMHCGFYAPSLVIPPSLLEIRCKVTRCDDVFDEFRSSSRNGIRSRAWGKSGFAKTKTSAILEMNNIIDPVVKKEEQQQQFDQNDGNTDVNGNANASSLANGQQQGARVVNGTLQTASGKIINADDFGMQVDSAVSVTVNNEIIELTPTPPDSLRYVVVPTFVPEDKERSQRTRAASNANINVAKRKRMIREVTVLYNLCNEPWLKYSMSAVADKGFKQSQWTSARLRRDTLYLETRNERYQLSWVKGKGKDENEGSYTFAKCKRALPIEQMRLKGIPLPKEELKDEIKNLSWNEVKFGIRGISVKDKEYPVCKLQFLASLAELI